LDGTTPVDVTISVRTTARSMAAPPLRIAPPNGRNWVGIICLFGLLLAWLHFRGGMGAGRPRATWALPVILLLALTWVACGGGPPSPPEGTPAGTYTLAVTATAGGLSSSTNLTLIVN
jgi:hypothetical protein